ncbi:hypothetical protein AArcCO_1411 [Halalkaliarchaeum sp. AArc-CO]|uniref:hypothetical protein n=1 Tax=Halalkaliarchaeum sp. AArc-CO TaxID=2866381 RepID=UPI00217EDDDA|nr:hypothetical protein [Halalkaliarchaeum sp. AArc-CO]UWG50718.1 hypothetical protein AArcCO_1411 [Halalkaliarchaeum sp. AArc-CO]
MSSWVPWTNRNSEVEQRIHEDLTDKAASRISFSLNQIASRGEIDDAYTEYRTETGKHVDYFETANSEPAKRSLDKFVSTEDLHDVLTLIEILVNELWEESTLSGENHSAEELLDFDRKLRRILVEEGILLRIRPTRDEVETFGEKLSRYREAKNSRSYSSRHRSQPRPEKPFNIHFETLADESVIESDQQLRALGKKGRWEEELSPYNEAWTQYQDEQFSYLIAEKLYNSLEAVLVKICVKERGWNNEGDGVSAYLNSIKDNGLFDPNEAMFAEWEQIINGLQIGVQRTGGDRKRHETFDQDYSILLLHQVGAFLTFVINRYEDQYPN